ncbi:MAG: MATE family efflux transporter [Pseudomonadota bacterium]|nr:MATE family efflux transporter [Pseudomonadota bacterium]
MRQHDSASATAQATAVSDRPSVKPVLMPMLSLSTKMTLAQSAPLLMSVVVAGLIAQKSSHSYAAYALMASFNMPIFIAAASMLQALYFLGGRALGRGRDDDYRVAMVAGFFFSTVVGLVCSGLSVLSSQALLLLGVDTELARAAYGFGIANAVGLLPALWVVVFRIHVSLRDRPGQATGVYILGSVCGAVLAALSMRRWGGDPAYASEMAIGAVSVSNWIMAAAAMGILLVLKPLRFDWQVQGARIRAAFAEVFAVGWPIGAVVLLDSLMLAFAAMVAGRYWPHAVPVHSVAALWVTFALVVPLGISQAVVQYVAVAHAEGDPRARNHNAGVAMALTLVFTAIAVVVFTIAAVPMGAVILGPLAYQANEAAALRQIMPWAGLVLGLQGVILVAAAILRGLGQTRAPFFQALVGYGVVGNGGQWILGVVLGGALLGLWQGLALGFGVTAVALSWRCARQLDATRHPILQD